jgi:hypothetical protein
MLELGQAGNMKCPKCDLEMLLINKSYICEICDKSIELGDIQIGEDIYISYEKHPLFMEQGNIIDSDHMFYRVRISCGPRSGHQIWVPIHWVRRLPDELRRSTK